MANTTPILNLNLPDYSLAHWDVPTNQNFTILDSAIGALQASVGAAAPPTWQKYTLASVTPNWMLNGVNAGGQSSVGPVQQIALFTAAARQIFHAVLIKHSVAFGGGAVSSIVVSVGIAATPDALMSVAGDTFDVLQAPSNFKFYLAGGARMLSAAATPVILQLSCVGGYPSALTVGTLEVDVLSSVLP